LADASRGYLSGHNITGEDNMAVVNVIEQLVWEYMDEVLASRADICRCEICRMDIAAYALNRLKPLYAATSKGEIMCRAQLMDRQLYLDIIVMLTEAVNVVAAKPHHQLGSLER